MKLNLLKSLCISLLACSASQVSLAQSETTPVDATVSPFAVYLDSANAIVANVNSGTLDAALIETSVDTMMDNVEPVIALYSAKYPGCAEQLTAMIALLPTIKTWTAVEIRQNIEAGKALPKAVGNCYPGRDIVAHPSIVRALALAGLENTTAARLLREINEGIEHMTRIQAEFEIPATVPEAN